MTIGQNCASRTLLALTLIGLPALVLAHSVEAGQPPRDPSSYFAAYLSASAPDENSRKVVAEKSGNFPVADGGTLRLTLQLGNVHVFTDASRTISYRASVQADPRDPGTEEFLREFSVDARRTNRGVTLEARVPWKLLRDGFSSEVEIHVPRRYSLEISTGGGNIDVRDIDGRIRLTSAGGSIVTGRVGGASVDKKDTRLKPGLPEAARIVTQGGEISVGDVQGTLRATTAGGHIVTGNIQGDAILRTAGGQIDARKIAGAAVLDSGGGNIHIESAGSSVAADTAGGGLAVRQAEGPLDVSAKDSNVTAWLSDVPSSKIAAAKSGRAVAATQVSSDGGDIVLYVPRSLAASIDAVIEQSNGRQIAADPSLSIKNRYLSSTDGDRTVRCVLQLNGGGKVIHLKAIAGNIVLRPLESVSGARPDFPPDLASAWVDNRIANPAPANVRSVSSGGTEDFSSADGFFAEMRQMLLETWWGGIPVDAEEMQKHSEHSVAPVYPEVARRAGVEGDVVLRVSVSPAGNVSEIKILEGPPILARAAVQAVQQWRYQAPRVNGRPASVTTTLVLSFRLH